MTRVGIQAEHPGSVRRGKKKKHVKEASLNGWALFCVSKVMFTFAIYIKDGIQLSCLVLEGERVTQTQRRCRSPEATTLSRDRLKDYR